MPVYCYKCECGRKVETWFLKMTSQQTTKCTCGKRMRRDYQAEQCTTTQGEYLHPVLSDGLAVNPRDIPATLKKYPEREYLPDGRCVIRSHHERNRIMKQDHCFDRDGYN